MSFFNTLFGTQSEMKQQPTQTPQQMQYLQQILQGLQGGNSDIQGMNYLNSLFSNDPQAFRDYEAPAMRQFNEQILPGIAERFTGMGAGSQNSSAFQQQATAAGSRLSENLAAQRANLRGQGINQMQGFGQMGLTPQFENIYMQGQPGLLQGLSGGLGQGFGQMGVMQLMRSMGLM